MRRASRVVFAALALAAPLPVMTPARPDRPGAADAPRGVERAHHRAEAGRDIPPARVASADVRARGVMSADSDLLVGGTGGTRE